MHRILTKGSSVAPRTTLRALSTVSYAIPSTVSSFIHGEYVNPSTTYDNYNPRDGSVLCAVSDSDSATLDSAIASAKEAFPVWSSMSSAERGRILTKAAAIMRENNEVLSAMESADAGSVITETRDGHIGGAADAFEYYGAIATTCATMGEYFGGAAKSKPSSQLDTFSYTVREPLGVTVGIGAWNYPMLVASWKVAPALACGNTMVYKPSEFSPLTSAKMAEILIEAGAPKGVLNVVTGSKDRSTGPYLVKHPDVKKISFTGSTDVGIHIAASAARSLKKVTMELGGKSPLIVCSDADIENAVGAAMNGNWYTQGAVCSNCTRVFVHESIKDQFIKRLVERTDKIVIGDPEAEDSQMGALIMPPDNKSGHYDKVMGFIERAKADPRNKLVYGGNRVTEGVPAGGYYVTPAIFDCGSDESEIATTEVFGPVMSIFTFKDDDDAVARANASPFGLGAGVMTQNLVKAHRIANQLQSGNVWINNYNLTPCEMPFGGVGMSGYGRELSKHSLESYTQIKHVYVELGDVDSSLYPE